MLIKSNMAQDIVVKVKLFAAFQEEISSSEMRLTLPLNAPVVKVFDELVSRYPVLGKWRSLIRYAVNLDFVEPDTLLQDGDEVALIPPVSGG
jgi:sulfur-carrier protein